MNAIRRILGIVWLLLGPAAIAFLGYEAYSRINAHPVSDVYLPWIIIVSIFTPIAIGLSLFGFYALTGEYDK
ncbi:MAG: hypothetical protein J0I41_06970 [Filimonas sp.]|nr:hypothetical protein [Filimonas sp.]